MVAVDTAMLREARSALTSDGRGTDPKVSVGRFGGGRAVSTVDRFESYWGSGRSTVTVGLHALSRLLGSAADVFEGRDAADADAFGVGSRAF
ncbi:hypothetical protein ACI2IX_14540 [Leifsonia aquatica]|uniref:hypothetical protein n=1 Tax=Leifsonia aquatica TaxID=144185 RepID=UPI00384C2446